MKTINFNIQGRTELHRLPKYGDVMPLAEFVDCVNSGGLLTTTDLVVM